MSDCTHDCSSCSAECGERSSGVQKAMPHYMSNVKKMIAVVSGKGGVGKSLVTSLLAVASSRKGNSTAILDADITGPSIPKMFGIHQKAMGDEDSIYPCISRDDIKVMSINLLVEDETSPVLWRGPVIAGTVTQFWSDVSWGDVDFMFVDMPPGTGDVPLTVFQSLPVDGIIVVTTPQDMVKMIVTKAVKMAKLMNIPILGLVENMSYIKCPDCGKEIRLFGDSHVDEIAAEFGLRVLAKLPVDPSVTALCDNGSIEDVPDGFIPEIEL
ncbi:MAG: Mrp/NBP35 family ATP-binding protein [Ruminococcus sp.]|nr:Mrp/NBP35 family ATP-binding protein [Ruminococcus sp.]